MNKTTNPRQGINLGDLAQDVAIIAAARGWSLSRTVRELLRPAVALERAQLARNLAGGHQ